MSVGLRGVAEDDPARPAVVEAGGTVLTFGELATRSNPVVLGGEPGPDPGAGADRASAPVDVLARGPIRPR